MKPVLFSIGVYNVYAFGFFLSISFVLSTFIVWKLAKDEFKEQEYLDAYLFTSIAALIGARLVYIIKHFNDFGLNFLRYIVVRETPGLSLLGGLLGGFIFLWWYTRKYKYNFLHILDIFSCVASLTLVFTKIGEQLAGAGFGRETNFPLAVKIVGLSGRRHPVEFYEAGIFLILTVILLLVYRKIQRSKWPNGLVFLIFTLVLSTTIFLLEFAKEYQVYLFGLSLKQVVAIGTLFAILFPLIKRMRILLNRR